MSLCFLRVAYNSGFQNLFSDPYCFETPHFSSSLLSFLCDAFLILVMTLV